jgi:hypothetical protein
MSPETHPRMDRAPACRNEGMPSAICGRHKLGWNKWERVRERSVSPIRKGTSTVEQAHGVAGEQASSHRL